MEALLWVDLETTGLVPETGYILEVGMILTDMQLNVKGIQTFYGAMAGRSPYDVKINVADEFVQNMHEVNGLWKDLEEAYAAGYLKQSEQDLDHEIADILQSYIDEFQIEKLYPAGSSVHFDTKWMEYWLPSTASKLSYRHLDVTSLKLATLVATGSYNSDKDNTAHRALPDAQGSLDWFKNYIFPAEEVSTQAAHLAKVIGNG